jgi:hypothetical protein
MKGTTLAINRRRPASFPNRRFRINPIIGIGVIAVAALAVAGVGSYAYAQTEATYSNCVVTKTDRTSNSDGQSQARVYTENCGTFEVSDNIFKGQFNSADTFGALQPGETYDFETIGFRNGFLSIFPNILEASKTSATK